MSISKAHKLGIACFFSALVPAFYGSFLAALPLFLFVGVCMIAPFLPRLGFFLPVISHGESRYKAVSLTFDDGPDPFSTEPLLALLDRHGVKATFFVVGKKVASHPHLIEKILEKGHSLGNHTYRHDNFCMLKSSRYLYSEISAVQEMLALFHVKALAFRPPVGITNPKLQGVLGKLGMVTVNFSYRGLDMGNRRLKGLSRRVLKHLQRGHIIALHDVMPKGDGALQFWLHEIDKILQGIKGRGFKVLPLSELIEQPVMIRTGDKEKT